MCAPQTKRYIYIHIYILSHRRELWLIVQLTERAILSICNDSSTPSASIWASNIISNLLRRVAHISIASAYKTHTASEIVDKHNIIAVTDLWLDLKFCLWGSLFLWHARVEVNQLVARCRQLKERGFSNCDRPSRPSTIAIVSRLRTNAVVGYRYLETGLQLTCLHPVT